MAEFDPEVAASASDKEPADMTPEERAEAAKHTLYEIVRGLTSLRVAAEFQAELGGVSEDDVQAVGLRAEEDEYRDLAQPDPEPEPAADQVFDSYEDAEAAGADPRAAADRIWEGGDDAGSEA